MRKPKSDYAFIVVCNPGYGFGLISCMNAQKHFGTNADWEIAYEDYTDEQRDAISNAFPFNVHWTHVSDLMPEVNDRRADKSCPLNRFWLSYWLLAHRVLREKKYKAVCVIQADTFVFVNLDVYFKIAETGIIISSEYAFAYINPEDLPFGNDRKVTDRAHCSSFDAITFLNQDYANVAIDTVRFQEEDAFDRESNFSVVALNRAICKNGRKDRVLRLDRHIWVCEAIWGFTRFNRPADGDRIYNDNNIQICAWHTRWWQHGRVEGEWRNDKKITIQLKDNAEHMRTMHTREHNYNLVKSFMERFNNMIPEIRSTEFVEGIFRRPKYELGEE